MSETKHFNYEGHVNLNQHLQIKDVTFLTPAKITAVSHGVEKTFLVSIDIINRKAYDERGNEFMSKEIFGFLDSVNTLPEDFFVAPEEVLETAAEAEREYEQTKEEFLGDRNE